MMAINSEENNQAQLFNCQTNLSPCSKNNVGTKETTKRTKVRIAIPNFTNFFILLSVLFVIILSEKTIQKH